METVKLLVLRLTERCNLRCAYCYAARDGEPPFDMDEETALHAVELCCPAGGSLRVQFAGGEPLLRLDLMEAVARFGRESGRKLTLAVQTNGTLLTPETCRRLKAIRCGVGVSLDGVGAANGLRVFPDGTASFDATVQGIRNLGQCGLRCGMTAVVTKASAASLGQLADLALYLGNVAGMGLDLFRPLGRGAGQDLSPAAEELELGLKALKRKTVEFQAAKVPFRLRELERLRKRRTLSACGEVYCYAQTSLSLAVDGRGDCWPCSSLAGRSEYFLGNLRKGLPEYNCKADALATPMGCKSCNHFFQCLGGCPAGRAEGMETNRLTCVMHRVLAEENG